MTRLEQLISDLEYIAESLHALHRIYESGCCNDCGIKVSCQCKPDWGGQVRYNCPFHQREEEKTDDIRPMVDSGTVTEFVGYLYQELPKWYARQPFDDLMYAVRKVAKDFIEEYGE